MKLLTFLVVIIQSSLCYSQCEQFCTRQFCITADHCGNSTAILRIVSYDVAILPPNALANHHAISDQDPAYFVTRRGFRVRLKPLRREARQWIVSEEFYPGESGSPVFDSNHNVCGVVLGNLIEHPKSFGRVAILASALSTSGVTRTRLDQGHQKRQ